MEEKIMSRYLPEIKAVEKGKIKAIRGREVKKYIKQKLKEERTKPVMKGEYCRKHDILCCPICWPNLSKGWRFND
jgi:hypothetical protein